MKQKITPYLQSLLSSPAIAAQYVSQTGEDNALNANDPLDEDAHEVVRGLVHKYLNRALIKVSYRCAAHCRFCTRIRQIGDPKGTLALQDVDPIILYLNDHPGIDEVILSGGDPLITPHITSILLEGIARLPSVKVIRIGTRLPFQSPESLYSTRIGKLLDQLDLIGQKKPVYLMLHIEHPDELTPEARECICKLRSRHITLLSQTVFLKDINDHVDTLSILFTELHHLGVIPYYLFHCDEVHGLEKFSGDIRKEQKIANQLRDTLSGIACPLYVQDSAHGKIPL